MAAASWASWMYSKEVKWPIRALTEITKTEKASERERRAEVAPRSPRSSTALVLASPYELLHV